ncbi:nuclear transport factor 2 family protein [Anaerocolumna sp. AGMB13025]|uniref:nuclear transport factor 2 family protein n=1 Tax=Anaerocolumna sp. AGMB13025 TaxID=3039116 RepID=UPI00241F0FB9|nr:nuclear transport factor 2 family protein [Anaerocolumna sp. AGMB13025]WFR59097.1 nuclear transport factor 2 family protein [Anaerocolumna sp. AGMB13025]
MYNKFHLPEPIEQQFHAANTDNPEGFLATFKEDATVFDAGVEYYGKAAIKEWSNKVYFKDHLRLELTNVVQHSKETVVTAIADGDFEKSGLPDPLFLDFHFVIEDSHISNLNIVLSSNSKAIPLPPSIAAYYHASDIYDNALLADCFTADALLYDEDEEFLGPEVISSHILKANREAKVTLEIMRFVEYNTDLVATAMLQGEFEGSPLPLDFHFTLENGKIKTLNITLEKDV